MVAGWGGETAALAKLIRYPAPAGLAVTNDFTVTVDGQPVDMYAVKTYHGGSANFASFDFSGSVKVEVCSQRPAAGAMVRPAAAVRQVQIAGKEISFTLQKACQLSIEVDGIERVLHLFANPIETHRPKPGDPGVIYYGPGVHEVTGWQLSDKATLYLAGGAVLRVLPPDTARGALINVNQAKGVRICGRGIIDMSGVPHHAQRGIVFNNAEDISVEGITLLDSADWTVAFFGCRNIRVDNLKEICRRENSDGLDICNSQEVTIENSFLRNNDDEICVKTTAAAPAPVAKNILVQHCVIWNERARGLGITSETRRDISNVTFKDCDIIHDYSENADCAALAVLVSDSGWMRNIRFENIRVADVKKLLRCWVGHDIWGHDAEAGHIDGLVFKNVTVAGPYFPTSALMGFDATHQVENVSFQNLSIQGRRIANLEQGTISTNAFVQNVRFKIGR